MSQAIEAISFRIVCPPSICRSRAQLGRPDQPTSATPEALVVALYGAVWYRLLPDEPLDTGFISGTIELAR